MKLIYSILAFTMLLVFGSCNKEANFPAPKAGFKFAFAPTDPTNFTIIFTDTSLNEARRIWYFGNGDTSTKQNPTYTYTGFTPGTKMDVKLVITSSAGKTDSSIQKINLGEQIPTITSITTNTLTPADYSCYTTNNFTNPGTNVTYTVVATNAKSYVWSFSDGSSDASTITPSITHTYKNSGLFATKLTITSISGDKETIYSTPFKVDVYDSIIINNITISLSVADKDGTAWGYNIKNTTNTLSSSNNLITSPDNQTWNFTNANSSGFPVYLGNNNITFNIFRKDGTNAILQYKNISSNNVWQNQIDDTNKRNLLNPTNGQGTATIGTYGKLPEANDAKVTITSNVTLHQLIL